ncbi:MAG: RNA polymerase sigma factor [Defluviitaleaceae bacterium]|nr:RNA polymerase sigma factor [Defluviitaleaceae bacterium]
MDIAEFESFLESHEKDIYTFCSYLTMDKTLAEDLYQDTILKAFEVIDKIDKHQNPKSFFFSIAAGHFKNFNRKTKRRQEIVPTVSLDDIVIEPKTGDNTALLAEKNMLNELVAKIIEKLDDKFRIPIILCYFDDLSEESISNILSIPRGTVKSRLYKARALIKQELERMGFSYE